MAEDAVESAGAKAPAITISTQQIIAGEGVLMPDERCPAVHPKLGLQCDRKVWDCWGIDHICTRENGLGEFCATSWAIRRCIDTLKIGW
jgi:hypothetical protein